MESNHDFSHALRQDIFLRNLQSHLCWNDATNSSFQSCWEDLQEKMPGMLGSPPEPRLSLKHWAQNIPFVLGPRPTRWIWSKGSLKRNMTQPCMSLNSYEMNSFHCIIENVGVIFFSLEEDWGGLLKWLSREEGEKKIFPSVKRVLSTDNQFTEPQIFISFKIILNSPPFFFIRKKVQVSYIKIN